MATPKSLADKLGVHADRRVLVVNAPPGAPALGGKKPPRGAKAELVLLYVHDQAELAERAKEALAALVEGGALWVAYPKKTSATKTDLRRDVGWAPLEGAGWERVSIAAVDATWSALRWKRGEAIPARVLRKAATKGAEKVDVPEDVAAALEHVGALVHFRALAPSHQREHLAYIAGAKTSETRARRVLKTAASVAGK